ncbi:MAG: formylglycine-generating enzyme family protein [Pseudomonadota bacterium]
MSTRILKLAVIIAVMLGLGFIIGQLMLNETENPAEPEKIQIQTNTCDPEAPLTDMVWVDGGEFVMGSNSNWFEESPARPVTVEGFWIRKYEVTNHEFAEFVAATNYVTTAEKPLSAEDFPGFTEEFLKPGSAVFVGLNGENNTGQIWQYIHGANWRHPTGPESAIEGLDNHPVVHISYEDAQAYAAWRGETLPNEAQWEFAARGGQLDKPTVSRDISPDVANTWQGTFPVNNAGKDGYMSTAPVGCFPANGFGLHDMLGNVWEWTDTLYKAKHQTAGGIEERAIKGGSYLCAKNFCARYRPSARQPQDVSLGTSHIGFRTIKKASTSAANSEAG